VFNIGEANLLPADSMELGIAVDGRHVEAVDLLLEIAGEHRKEGIFHTSPFSLRFTAPSRAYASMMYGQPTMMIELYPEWGRWPAAAADDHAGRLGAGRRAVPGLFVTDPRRLPTRSLTSWAPHGGTACPDPMGSPGRNSDGRSGRSPGVCICSRIAGTNADAP